MLACGASSRLRRFPPVIPQASAAALPCSRAAPTPLPPCRRTLPTTRVANTSQHTTLPRGHADEEDSFEPGNVLGGEWDARSW